LDLDQIERNRLFLVLKPSLYLFQKLRKYSSTFLSNLVNRQTDKQPTKSKYFLLDLYFRKAGLQEVMFSSALIIHFPSLFVIYTVATRNVVTNFQEFIFCDAKLVVGLAIKRSRVRIPSVPPSRNDGLVKLFTHMCLCHESSSRPYNSVGLLVKGR